MAVINATLLSLLDSYSRRDPDGKIASIVEILTQRTVVMEDLEMIEANGKTGHIVTTRTALPGITYRRYNEGVLPTKSRTDQVSESIGKMAGMSKVDVELAALHGDGLAFRATEDDAFLQSFANEVETGFFYNATNVSPEKWQGLAPRFASTTGPGGSQIIKMDASASGNDQASLWLVGHGPQTVHGIFPSGEMLGLNPYDGGKQLTRDANNAEFWAWVTTWTWNFGVCVKDWRYVCRVANIDMGNILATGSALIDAMIKAQRKIFKPGARLVWYGNRDVLTFLELQAKNAVGTAGPLSWRDIGGVPILTFRGVPIKETDALLSTESPIT
jgi:hypothetical protein